MKKNIFLFSVGVCFVLWMNPSVYSEDLSFDVLRNQSYFGDFALQGSWKIDEKSVYPIAKPGGGDKLSINKITSRTYFIDSGSIPKTKKRIGYGGAINFKYYSGFSYDYLQKNLPGKTIY